MLIGVYKDYRKFLQDELEQRQKRNLQYSLRAFARDLNIAPQVLSLVLKGKKGISVSAALNLAHRLGLSVEESSYFYDLVSLSQARTEPVRQIVQFRLASYKTNHTFRTLEEDVLQIISDSHHYAILELTLTDDFVSDPDWIASRLGLTKLETNAAITRLLRLELLKEENGQLKKTEEHISSSHDIPSSALRKMTSQLLEKAQKALQTQSINERDFSTLTMAIDPKKIPQAKEMITKFRRELMNFLESGDRTEVYSFAAQLFRISSPEADPLKPVGNS